MKPKKLVHGVGINDADYAVTKYETIGCVDGKQKQKSIISLFSGCGGMDLGMLGGFTVHKNCINPHIHKPVTATANPDWVRLPRNDFEIIFANDILPEAYAAYTPYFKKSGLTHPFYKDSIVDLVKKAESNQFDFPRADIVIGGFPCQDFSVAGKRLGLSSHKCHTGQINSEVPSIENRGQLYAWMKKVIELTEPKMFIAENVKGLASLGDVKQIIEDDFRNVGEGYIVQDAKVLNAINYGVPQSRERVFFIGFNKKYLRKGAEQLLKSGHIDPYPPATHWLPGQQADHPDLNPFVSLSDILLDLPEPDNAMDPAQAAYSKAKYYGRHVQGQTEINLAGVGPTIRAEHHGNIEFRRLAKENGGKISNELAAGLQQRRLTVRECARIQTFPDDYEFIRKKTKDESFPLSASGAYRVIGNAVPPLLAYNIATHIESLWNQLFE